MDTLHLLYIANIGFIVIIFLIHLRFTKKDLAANRILSVFFFSMAYTSLLLLLFSTKWILHSPHLYRTGNIFLYLTFPAAFLYMRKILRQEGWRKTDLLHLLPAILYIIDFAPFFLMSSLEKRIQLEADLSNDAIYSFSRSWFLAPYFHFFFRNILALVYLFFMSKLWFSNFVGESNNVFRKENRSLGQWYAVLIILLSVWIVPIFLVAVFKMPIDLTKVGNSSAYIITTSFAFFLFFKPEIIYGVKGLWMDVEVPVPMVTRGAPPKTVDNFSEYQTSPTEESRKIYLTSEQVEILGRKIDNCMTETQSYLRLGYTIGELSFSIKTPVSQISAFLNSQLDMNFNEYINTWRIKHLLQEFDENPDLQRYTMEAVGQTVGFNSRHTFLKAFKKYTGETPAAYLKKTMP